MSKPFFWEKETRRDMTAVYHSLEYHIALTEPDLEMIKANILTKVHDDHINNKDKVACLMDHDI